MIPKTPYRPRPMEPGCALADRATLRAWLDTTAGQLVRLPCTLPFRDTREAHVGELAFPLDDTALGVGVATHAKDGAALWLEGHWRAPGILRVVHVAGRVEGEPTHALIEVVS